MLPVFGYVLVIVSGFLTKLTDNLVDERFLSNPNLKYATGLAYGIVTGYLISLDTALATLVSSIVIGNLLFGRIDHRAHQLALAGMFFMILLFGLKDISIPILAAFALFAWLDEFLNEKSDRGELNIPTPFNRIVHHRIMLEIAALTISLYTQNPIYFFSLLLFDLSYQVTDNLMFRVLPGFESGYGDHIVLNFYKCSSRKLGSGKFVREILNMLVEMLGMRAISRPVIVEYKGKRGKKDSGISGFILIAESHISIHTYPERRLVKVDVMSCKRIDSDAILNYLRKIFGSDDFDYKILDRGKEYPKDTKLAKKIVMEERRLVNSKEALFLRSPPSEPERS